MSVVIPDDILKASQMTEDELKLELALLLYKQEKIMEKSMDRFNCH